MANIKRGTTPTLEVRIGEIDISEVERIDFVFKYKAQSCAPKIIEKHYPDDGVSYDSDRSLFEIEFSESETYSLKPYENLFMDTRIVLAGGFIPDTSIVRINVKETLF